MPISSALVVAVGFFGGFFLFNKLTDDGDFLLYIFFATTSFLRVLSSYLSNAQRYIAEYDYCFRKQGVSTLVYGR